MVQNEGTHILQRQNHEHAHSSRSVQGPVQGGVTQGSIRGKAHRLPDNAHSNGQHFSGAMERYMHMRGSWVRFGKTHVALPRHTANSEHTSSGAMDESSGKGSKVQAHIISGVVMDIATIKVSHAVGVDIHATALQAKKSSA